MNENEILEEEIAEIVGEEKTDTRDDEFEYDENGDIIIPDVDEDGEEKAEEEVGDVTEEPSADDAEGEENPAEDEEEPAAEEDTEKDTKASEGEELARLRALVKDYETRGKDVLEKLGVKNDDVLGGLTQLAAETDGKSTEEYVAEMQQKRRMEEAMELLKRTEFEKMAAADLAGLKAIYPELKDTKTIFDIPNWQRFGELRDKGLSVKEAYSAANPDAIRKNIADAVTRQNLNESKSHLKSNVPKGTKDTSLHMSREELASWREMFPKMSDSEIIKLYRKTAN
jgi:casein kinase II subunit beta